MNENIDLTKILKNCPKGTKFYSTIFGEVEFSGFYEDEGYVIIIKRNFDIAYITKDGRYLSGFNGECTLFPSKDQRDWSKFTASWYKKKEKFNPKALKPFDKVLVKYNESSRWDCRFFSYIDNTNLHYKCRCIYGSFAFCIPYNEDTKHLVGTTDEAPEYYKYWEE